MRNFLIILAGIVIGVALRYTLPPASSPVTAPVADLARAQPTDQDTKPVVNPAYVEPDLYVRGYVVLGRRANVFLSDGTTWTEQHQGELKIYRHYVTFRGKTYPIKSDPRLVAPQPVTPWGQPSAAVIPSPLTHTLSDTVGVDLMNASRK